jgi:tryptophan synthase alpha chain
VGADRLAAVFQRSNRAVLLPFLTAGIPEPERSVEMFVAMAEAGADGFEVGIPYADPLMDGPIIQAAAARALAAGVSLERSLELVAEISRATGKPLLVMTYVNPVLHLGAEHFAREAAAAGADGVIVADLPVDEAGPIQEAVVTAGLGMVLFAAPTTDDARLASIAAARPAFVYGIADLGVTGERAAASDHAARLARRVRAVTDAPLVLGVGISTPEQAAAAGELADGVIVGSALVRRALEDDDPAASLRAATADFVAALDATAHR